MFHFVLVRICVCVCEFTMLRIDRNGRSSCELDRILLRGLCTSQLH